ncbi:PepSY domain-containing protein [Henriciella litoralis]|uniref:PepSY domain-containing protein n=1 Tax=Henriciella litoralis TaxID=568102 RepID=UPI00146D1C9F|nr:PepSY domain-containing protein [Henriciella litoralis]
MLKAIIILHRYLGVCVGLIMTIWCLSGFVMMYQGYPDTSSTEQEASQQKLDFSGCCDTEMIGGADSAPASSFRIEMRADEPVVEVRGGDNAGIFSLRSGARVEPLDRAHVATAIDRFMAANGIEGDIVTLEEIEVDQWTVYMWRRAAPLWKATLNDRAGTYLYVSGASGKVVQDANRQERIVAWLGAIPHWLYPQLLRQNQPLWYQTVIWLTVLGIFLTGTGLLVGIVRLRGRSGRWFPYRRPVWLWHHMIGVFAGLLVLTWTASGLLTMAPWGLLQSEPSTPRSQVAGAMSWEEARLAIEAARRADIPDLLSLKSAPLAGQPYLIANTRDGSAIRIGPDGPSTLSLPDLQAQFEAHGLSVETLSVLRKEDGYYYGHKRDVELPVIRIVLNDPDRTRVYLHPETGEILRFVSATTKRYRWLENGFHNFDWPILRQRPVWDIVVILLLLGVTGVCATGTWMAYKRVGQDFKRARKAVAKRSKISGGGRA